jgi:riboflavin transporter FmnP
MRIIGLPDDVIALVKVWLKGSFYFVSKNGENSYLYDLLLGTLQGSVLGPVLYALFVSPLFEIVPALSFTDDGHNMKTSKDE